MRQETAKRFLKIFPLAAIALGGILLWRSYQDLPPAPVYASASQNVTGWAWSDMPHGSDEVRNPGGGTVGRGAGWLSFNSTNCDRNDDGRSDGPPPDGCPPSGTVVVSYGVHISPSDGTFSGYAWSEHAGWISFNRSETGTPPMAPYNGGESFITKLDFPSRLVSGWARVLATDGGWDGWIKLRGTATDGTPYGVSWDPPTSELRGWGWGDRVLGWLSFNCLNQGVCPASNYRVRATVDTVPPVVTLDQPNGVVNATTFRVNITAEDAITGVVEGNADVTIDGGSWVDTGLPGTPAGNIFPPPPSTASFFDYTGDGGRRYRFRYQARDGAGNWSTPPVEDGELIINRPPATPDPLSPPLSPENGVNTFTLFPLSPLTPILSWSTFSDPDGLGSHSGAPPGSWHTDADTQSAYQAQIATEPGFSAGSIVCGRDETSCFFTAASNSMTVPGGVLAFDRSYFWRVKVRDNHGLDSTFGPATSGTGCRGVGGEACSFFTPPSSPPTANFSFRPLNPSVNEEIRFTDLSRDTTDSFSCPRGGCHIVAWEWVFTQDAADRVNVEPSYTSTLQHPVVKYKTKGTRTVTLKVQDNDGQWSEVFPAPVGIRPELPEFREVAPR